MSAFVGRVRELESLADVLAQASSGPAAAVVIGAPGSGKSRLLAEARERVRVQHSFAVVGYEPERQVPLAAAAGFLRTLAEVPGDGPPLEALLFGSDHHAALDPVRVFEAAHRAFRACEPALLVVDDLQWMDDLSYALCHYLIRAAHDGRRRVAIFAATRPDEQGVALVDALPGERVTTIELLPLALDEGIELALALDPHLDRARASDLHERARGSPFWLETLVQAEAVTEPGPLLTPRLRGAGADVAALLGLLAVTGRPLVVGDIPAILDWPLERTEEALVALVRRGLAVEKTGSARVTHDLIRQAAVADLPDEMRRMIHRRLATWLELEGGTDLQRLREALEHRRAAGIPTLDLALRLARSPRRTLLGAEGLRVLAAIAEEAERTDELALVLQEEIAALATDVAAHDEALARWLIVAERAEAPVRRAWALLGASKAAFALDRVAEAREHLESSRQVEEVDAVLGLEQTTHDAAICLWLEQRTAQGRARAREAVAAATRLAAEPANAASLAPYAQRAYIDALRLDYEAAMQEGDAPALLRAAEARERATRGSSVESQLAASLAVGAGLRACGRVHEAADRFRRLWDEAHRHVLPRLAVDAGVWLAQSLASAASLAEAEEVVGETSELASRAGDVPRARHRVARIACSIELERGRPHDALRRLEHETAQEQNTHQRIQFHQDLAVWHARLDGAAAAAHVHEQLAAGEACAEAIGCPRCGAELLLYSAEALARIGEREEARKALARWEARGIVGSAEHAMEHRHVSAVAEDDPVERSAALGSALGAAEQSPYALAAIWIALDRGLALAETGDDSAIAVLEGVADAARDRGAGTVEMLAAHALRSRGVRTWRRSVAGAPLTTREQEVAQLAAGGATNREIASTLFLSPKTVERHLSNVFRKIGARNRTELAARLRDGAPQRAGNAR